MGWLPVVTISKPVFLTLVWAFYLRATYGMGGPIISTIRGVEIRLDPEDICRIFDIPPIGLKVYESKMWSTVPGFEPREAIQRICGLLDDQGKGKPSTHNLTVISRVLHHMLQIKYKWKLASYKVNVFHFLAFNRNGSQKWGGALYCRLAVLCKIHYHCLFYIQIPLTNREWKFACYVASYMILYFYQNDV